MHKPQSSAELRRSLQHAVECAEHALASERRQSLAGVRAAFTGLQRAIAAVESARLEWFEITPADEDELRAMVQRIRALVAELLRKMDGWSPAAAVPRRARGARWLN